MSSLEEMTAGFLRALGAPEDPELTETPNRVATLWRDNLLSGYASDPATALGEKSASRLTTAPGAIASRSNRSRQPATASSSQA